MYTIEYAVGVAEDLADLRAYDRKRVLNRIEGELRHQPTRETRNRKPVFGLQPPWDYEEPTWELRIGEFRAFYDVDDSESLVTVRAIRRKPPHKTTEDIL